jgi:hypothetical protein
MKGLKSLIKEIALENNLDIHTTEMIIRSQFKMVLKEAQADTLNPIRLIYLGVFKVKPFRKKKMDELREKINQRKSNTNES